MQTESPALVRQKEHVIREKTETDTGITFSSTFHLLVLERFSCVSSSHFWIQCETPFRSPPQNGRCDFRISLHLPSWCSTCVFTISRPAAYWLSISSRPPLPPRVARMIYLIQVVLQLRWRFMTSSFFNFFFNYHCRYFCFSTFLFFLLSFLPQDLASSSFYN